MSSNVKGRVPLAEGEGAARVGTVMNTAEMQIERVFNFINERADSTANQFALANLADEAEKALSRPGALKRAIWRGTDRRRYVFAGSFHPV